MGKLRDMAAKLKALDFAAMCESVVLENENEAVELNRTQLFQGERADGSEMPPYSYVSVNFFNKPDGPIRLFDTGDFYEGFIFAKKTFPLSITSTDSKTSELQERYGNEIFGINRENLSGFAKAFIIPSLQTKYKEYIHL